MKKGAKIGSKNILLILGAIVIVAGAFVLAEFRNTKSQKIVYTASIATSTIESISPELASKDSDGDGLKDWEEVLLGTDPHNPDTDGDGTPDGKEVAAGRNPLVKGPNDSAKVTSLDATSKEKLTPTEILSRNFFARYMELNQAGNAGDASSQAELIDQVIKDGMVLATPKVYTAKDILTTANDTTEAIKSYGNTVGNIFKKFANPLARNELVIAKESIDNETPDTLKELDPIATTYRNILNAVLKVSAPSSLASTHLLLVNSLSTLLFSTESLRKVDKDTLAGIQGSGVWLSGANALNKSFNDIKASFVSHGITYQPDEGGAFFIPEQ